MKKTPVSAACGVLLLASAQLPAHEPGIDKHAELVPIPAYSLPYGAAGATSALQAAQAFLGSLDAATRARLVFAAAAPERSQWSNLPAGIVDRHGLSVGEMSDQQRALLFAFLASSLSKDGYQQVMNIMAAEAFLSQEARATRLQWAPENYWISFYGEPAAGKPWGWQYGGHHLALNMAMADNRVRSMSPTFVGSEPALFSYKGVDYESVVGMHRAAYAVFAALDKTQQAEAGISYSGRDIVTGPGKDGLVPKPIGLAASAMNTHQQALLLTAIAQWVGMQPQENAERRMQQIKRELTQLHFAWQGSEQVNSRCYLRIQGPSLIIELHSSGRNVGRSAARMGHYHSVYRNPQREYGRQ